jgi:hypothetical protein
MESFPNNTVVQFETLLPHPLDLKDGNWEVALTDMMYSVDLKNISTQEAYFDVFIPQQHGRTLTDHNVYRWDRLTMQKIGLEMLANCPALVIWDQTQWKHYVTRG